MYVFKVNIEKINVVVVSHPRFKYGVGSQQLNTRCDDSNIGRGRFIVIVGSDLCQCSLQPEPLFITENFSAVATTQAQGTVQPAQARCDQSGEGKVKLA